MVTEVRPEFQNANSPMVVTELGMDTEVRCSQPRKSWYSILLVVFVGLFGSGVDCFDDNDARIMKTKDKSQGIKNFHIMSN